MIRLNLQHPGEREQVRDLVQDALSPLDPRQPRDRPADQPGQDFLGQPAPTSPIRDLLAHTTLLIHGSYHALKPPYAAGSRIHVAASHATTVTVPCDMTAVYGSTQPT